MELIAFIGFCSHYTLYTRLERSPEPQLLAGAFLIAVRDYIFAFSKHGCWSERMVQQGADGEDDCF